MKIWFYIIAKDPDFQTIFISCFFEKKRRGKAKIMSCHGNIGTSKKFNQPRNIQNWNWNSNDNRHHSKLLQRKIKGEWKQCDSKAAPLRTFVPISMSYKSNTSVYNVAKNTENERKKEEVNLSFYLLSIFKHDIEINFSLSLFIFRQL